MYIILKLNFPYHSGYFTGYSIFFLGCSFRWPCLMWDKEYNTATLWFNLSTVTLYRNLTYHSNNSDFYSNVLYFQYLKVVFMQKIYKLNITGPKETHVRFFSLCNSCTLLRVCIYLSVRCYAYKKHRFTTTVVFIA